MKNQENYHNLSKLVEKLKKSEDPKRKYEYIFWLGKKLKEENEIMTWQEMMPEKEQVIKADRAGGLEMKFN